MLFRSTHKAVRAADGAIEVVDDPDGGHAEFMVLHEGGIVFEGSASELLASTEPYLQRFLYRTLPPW